MNAGLEKEYKKYLEYKAIFEKRDYSEQMDEIIGKEFPVLDHGYIRVIDYMGTDKSVVDAARVSYGEGTRAVSDDKNLIRYLYKHGHMTPFEMCSLKIQIRTTMDTWRQIIRQRTAKVNEYSTRYSIAIRDMAETSPDSWRIQSKDNKQGSCGFLDETKGIYFSNKESEFHNYALELYNERLDAGIAREQARKDLPLSTYTVAYWKIDLRNLFNFLSQRLDSHAQKEIRSYANILGDIVSKWVPYSWESFNNYDFRQDAKIFSKYELICLSKLLRGEKQLDEIIKNENNLSKREKLEFKEKIQSLITLE